MHGDALIAWNYSQLHHRHHEEQFLVKLRIGYSVLPYKVLSVRDYFQSKFRRQHISNITSCTWYSLITRSLDPLCIRALMFTELPGSIVPVTEPRHKS